MPQPTLAPASAPFAPPAEARPLSTWLPRWNFSRHAATFRAADAFVVSIQKSGRTWVRVFMAAYFAERDASGQAPVMPAHVYTHDRWEHATKGHLGGRLRGKWLIPRSDALRKPILLVARDPRDVMVSLFFHLSRRTGTYRGDLPGLLRHPVYGIRRIVAIMNAWLAEWSTSGRLHLLRYEDAHADPYAAFSGALRFLLPGSEPDGAVLARAIEIASFENMRRLEAGDLEAPGAELVAGLKEEALRPCNVNDPDSFKVRRGKVGGYFDYLPASEIAFLDRELARLNPRYGYTSAGNFRTAPR